MTNINNNAITNGSIATFNDPTRGYVLSCTAPVGDGVTYTSISTNYPTPASFTRCFWVYVIKLGNFSAVDFVCSYNVPIFIIGTIVKVSFQNNNGADQNTLSFDNGATFVGKWTHFAVTNNRTNTSTNAGTATLYINGVNKATYSSTFAGDGSGLNAGGGLTIGDWYNVRAVGSNAYYDSIRCYNRALSASEIKSIYDYENYKIPMNTGWTLNGSAAYSTNYGNSILVPSGNNGNNYATYNYGSSLIGRSIYFTINSSVLCNLYFGCNSSGSGQMFRFETRSTYTSGISKTNSWTDWVSNYATPTFTPSTTITFSPNTSYNIKVTILSSTCYISSSSYNNGATYTQSFAYIDNGNYIGLQGDNNSGNSYFSNIYIYYNLPQQFS